MDSFSNKQHTWPSGSQWKQFHRVLSSKEKAVLPILFIVFIFSAFSFGNGVYFSNANIMPTRGGSVTEGMVGSPRFLNPLYADTNDVDRDLIGLLYSGILQHNGAGELVTDLASAMPEITEGGKVVNVSFKENVQWHDGTPFTADDVVFTIAALKDPASKSPIRANWIGIDMEKVSDYKIRFHLIDPYAPFLERLTLKILPAHLWSEVSPENLALTPLNLQPIGTGPYVLEKISQDRSGFVRELQLRAYEDYHKEGPFIESFTFRFFENETDLLAEAARGTIQSFSLTQVQNIQRMKNPAFKAYAFPMPRYFGLFFNLQAPAGQKETEKQAIRKALQLSLDKETLVQNVFGETARAAYSPLFPEIYGFSKPDVQEDQEQALALLQEQGYVKEEGVIGKAQLNEEALTRDLVRNDSGEDVRALQQCLAQEPDVYPEGIVNGNFGNLTYRAVIRFQEKYATEVLAQLGLSKGTGKAGELTRTKLNALCFSGSGERDPLAITITTVEQSPLKEVAQEIKKQWEEFGIQVEVQTFSPATLERDVIKPRAYQTLLFGEVLGTIPDPFPFWHSSQVTTPGLNLSRYENKTLDALLESTRKEFDAKQRSSLLQEMQDIILNDTPALFLYEFDHHYFVNTQVQGIETPVVSDPSWRFAQVAQWFIKTKKARQ